MVNKNYIIYLEKKINKSKKKFNILKNKIKSNNHNENKGLNNKLKHYDLKISKLKYSLKMYNNFMNSNKNNDNNFNTNLNDFVSIAKLISMLNISHLYKFEENNKLNDFEKLIKISNQMKTTKRVIPKNYNKDMSSIFTILNNIYKKEKDIQEINENHKYLINKGFFSKKKIEVKNNEQNNNELKKIEKKQNDLNKIIKDDINNDNKIKKKRKRKRKNKLGEKKSITERNNDFDNENAKSLREKLEPDVKNDNEPIQKTSFLSKKLSETKLLYKIKKKFK